MSYSSVFCLIVSHFKQFLRIKYLFLFSIEGISVVRGGCVAGGCDPNDPNSFSLTIRQMCELVPDRGHGFRDIVRIYYNPVLQTCLPFSWSGEGGNANRFVSIKNCYEICHPADPGIRKLTGSGIRAYLTKKMPPKHCSDDREGIPELGIPPVKANKSKERKQEEEEGKMGRDVVIRQMQHPYDPSKTLTIVQPVKYLIRDRKEKPRVIIEKHIRHVPTYVTPQQQSPIQPMQPIYQPQPPPMYQPPSQNMYDQNNRPELTNVYL